MLADDVVWPLVVRASSILVVQFAARSNGSGSSENGFWAHLICQGAMSLGGKGNDHKVNGGCYCVDLKVYGKAVV